MSAPVTVAITRHLSAGHDAEMMSWLNAGITLAERFPGFLGAGWVRPEADSETWHMLYRFADHASLEQWEHSPQRQWWRSSASGLGVVEDRVEKRSGIEGWFDVPSSTVIESGPLSDVPCATAALEAGHGDLPGLLPAEPGGQLAGPRAPRRRRPAAAGARNRAGDDPGDDLPRAAVDHPAPAVVAAGPPGAVARQPALRVRPGPRRPSWPAWSPRCAGRHATRPRGRAG